MKAYRLAIFSALALASVPAAALTACGSGSSADGDDASTTGNGDASGADTGLGRVVIVPPPDGSTTLDAAPQEASVPEPDASTIDCNEVFDQTQVFVSKKPGSGANAPCNAQTPCNSIATALTYAATKPASVVYIDEGTYTEQVVIPSTIRRVRGGWIYANGTWTIDCTSARLMATTIIAPSTANKTIIAQDLGGSTSLESLNIESKSAAGPGESLYGIFATGATTSLTLVDTSVLMQAGGTGANGSDGTAGGTGMACTAGTNPAATATPATAATAGGARATYSVTGATVTLGGTGAAGSAGGAGTMGADDCDTGCVTCERNDFPGEPSTCVEDGTDEECATGGGAGCGGGAGGIGGGGQGGGSSIALYAFDALVTVTNGVLQPGMGGGGGNGGGAGAAGPATAGAAGLTGTCGSACGTGTSCKPTGETLKGGAGVNGAPGAAGVGGGGGAGGDSFAYYQNNNNVTIATPGVGTAAAGPAGQGSPAGASGVAGTHN